MFLLCKRCEGKESCKMLCKQAELYVNQDNATQNYALLGDDDNYVEEQKWPNFIVTAEVILSMFFKEKKGVMKIAKTLKIDHAYVSRTIKKFRPIYEVKIQKRAISTPNI